MNSDNFCFVHQVDFHPILATTKSHMSHILHIPYVIYVSHVILVLPLFNELQLMVDIRIFFLFVFFPKACLASTFLSFWIQSFSSLRQMKEEGPIF